MKLSSFMRSIALGISTVSLVQGNDQEVILEFKAAYFQPTSSTFKHIYGGGAIFGPEITFHLYRALYGFASYDFFSKRGNSLGLCTPTKVTMHALAIGLKCMGCVADGLSLYAGLGFQPVLLQTRNCSDYVLCGTSKWGCGGIATFGMYIDVPYHFTLDVFLNYSFVDIKPACGIPSSVRYIQTKTANISGFIFGAGLGYVFN